MGYYSPEEWLAQREKRNHKPTVDEYLSYCDTALGQSARDDTYESRAQEGQSLLNFDKRLLVAAGGNALLEKWEDAEEKAGLEDRWYWEANGCSSLGPGESGAYVNPLSFF